MELVESCPVFSFFFNFHVFPIKRHWNLRIKVDYSGAFAKSQTYSSHLVSEPEQTE